MATIIYVQADGRQRAIDVPGGSSVMQGAITNRVAGIVAECGGNCICATCHVFVDPPQLALLPAMSPEEAAMLDGTAVKRRPNSRLSCQIRVEESLEGLRVHLPECQT
jgi:2Fe-2S ferredoxin